MKRLMSLVLCAGLAVAGPLAAQEEVETGAGATLRALDKVNGSVRDIKMRNASSARFGRLTINLGECRYPVGDPAGDAYAFLTIQEDGRAEPRFSGWMVASAPALNALDHPRYDVWVMRCNTNA
ncbi:DUF2155 domain-containing protein [Roseovarius sp. E0-M6]|uniref:DUF2155 domain-containing protein n=1 Tax=Roseovarius sp. E0-M6 TaxID=3127118 RepID=UPI00301010C9